MKHYRKFLAFCLAAVMLLTAMPTGQAATSDDIRDEIEGLEAEQEIIQNQLDELEAQQSENWESIEEMVAYKNSVDQQIFLIYSQIDNLNRQISHYSTLIVESQAELDEAQKALEELNLQYRARIRAMEEEGSVSYWEVLFKANSFLDLIDRLNMIKEIAEADQRMMDEIRQVTEEVRQKKESLMTEKAALETSRAELETAWADLEEKRSESDAILQELNANQAEMDALHEQLHAEKQALVDEIAKSEMELTAALKAEEEERRRQEEEKRRQEEEERRRQEEEERRDQENQNPTDPDEENDPEPEETKPTEPEPDEPATPPSSDNGWRQPCSYIYISSPYGWRSSGWHNGVDFAANRGTPIYATRSGTVSKAISLTYSYGNYVVINHGDGYSSLYAHMDYFVVSAGQYVQQGQLIGYVGSTGNSSGPHLHLTFFYNGSTVNPMDYL